VLRPRRVAPGDEDLTQFGASVNETRAFALTALQRRLRAIGLSVAAA
jgi:hypothetical protein